VKGESTYEDARMTAELSNEMIERLETQKNIWFGSVRPDGRPHLAPIWFVWHRGKLYVSTEPDSVKSGNVRRNPQVVLALEDGTHPMICEGQAQLLEKPWPKDLAGSFLKKYEWDLNEETQYNQVIEVTPGKWLNW
jgi:F420H(2)-dependent biliverdin reductase